MFKKKTSIFALVLAFAAVGITGCGTSNASAGTNNTPNSSSSNTEEKETSNSSDNSGSDKYNVVCTIFPEYDWVKEIVGSHAENFDITYLLDNGVDLHSYQPTADDMLKISSCDMFVYVGGESDEWVDDILESANNKDMKVINLMDVLGDSAKVEELKEGMQESEHEHDHSKEVSTFEDDEVKDRSLSDWAGEWQSPYPFVLDGTLDEAWEAMAETKGKMTAAEYKEYYKTGYETDIKSVKIDGDNITYTYDNGKSVSSDYKYTGYFIQDWSGGTRAAMYRFEAEDKNSGAPVYIEFNDHMIEPAEAEHFHLRMSNESYDAIADPEKYWPTFFPADMSGEDICDHLAGHDKDEDEHEHEHEEGEEEEEYDEHVWLSLKNAEILCTEIESSIAEIDPANSADYKANLDSYISKLDELDGKFQTLVDGASVKTLVFGDRFPFRYFVDDYGLDYYAAFIGCSAESEASFETIAFLADKVKELDCDTVFTLENSNKSIAEAIISTSGKDVKIAELNSLQSVSNDEIKSGVNYISLMEKNYDVLKETLK